MNICKITINVSIDVTDLNSTKNKPKVIALEEHFATPLSLKSRGRWLNEASTNPSTAARSTKLVAQLLDLGEGRIAAMDEAGIDMQILSLTAPGVEQLDVTEAVSVARDANERVAEATRLYPKRLAGFATIPTSSPKEASETLEKAVHEYGFKGAMINGHIRGRYLDDRFFWPILERAEALKVPLYIHPTVPPQQVIETSYKGNFSEEVSYLLATAGWGWHIETALHVLRLIFSGAFDSYPELQVMVGHLGEALPFMLHRIDRRMSKETTKLHRSVAEYLRENIYYTFGGFNFTPAFLNLLLEVGADRIMFSADHPYLPMSAARSFLDDLPVSPVDKAKIAHGNAEKLMGLNVV